MSAVCAYLVVLACTLMLAIYPPAERVPPEFAADLLGSTGVSHIYSLLNFRQVQEDLREAGKKKLEIDVLPQTWVDRIKAANSTVDTIPWEISYVPANDLRWIPNPTFQLFEAYNRPLDAREAAHFANAATAPDYLIWDYSTHTVDSRCALWDPPLTIQTIVQCYAPTSVEVGPRPRLLLARRPQSLHEELKTIKTDPIPESAMSLTTESVSSVVAVPDSPKRVYTSLDMKLTPLGQIVKFLYRVPPVYMGIVLRNHQSLVFHIIPDIAHEPMIIDSLPQQPQGLAELFANKGKSEDRTAAFALIGQGLRFYSKPIHVTWYEGMEFSEHHDK